MAVETVNSIFVVEHKLQQFVELLEKGFVGVGGRTLFGATSGSDAKEAFVGYVTQVASVCRNQVVQGYVGFGDVGLKVFPGGFDDLERKEKVNSDRQRLVMGHDWISRLGV